MMAEKQIGALPILEDGNLVGIVSERDFARKVFLPCKASKETSVTEIMSSPVFSVTPSQTVEECMHIVTEKRFRHCRWWRWRVVGMVSIGTGELGHYRAEATIHHLESFIAGHKRPLARLRRLLRMRGECLMGDGRARLLL